jgi:hypothetical protein
VYIGKRQGSSWNVQPVKLNLPDANANRVSHIVPLSPLGVFALAAKNCVHFVEAETCEVVRTFETETMVPKSLQCTFSGPKISKTGSLGLESLTLCYVGEDTCDCVMQTYVPMDDYGAISFRNPNSKTNGDEYSYEPTKRLDKRIKNPGTWQVLSDGSVVGIRLVLQNCNGTNDANPGFRRRRRAAEDRRQYSFANWEVWVTSPCVKPNLEECRPLFEVGDESNHLEVSDLGPKVSVGLRSVAFAFGNVIKLVTSGPLERYGADAENKSPDGLMNTAGRRRRLGQPGRTRAFS